MEEAGKYTGRREGERAREREREGEGERERESESERESEREGEVSDTTGIEKQCTLLLEIAICNYFSLRHN